MKIPPNDIDQRAVPSSIGSLNGSLLQSSITNPSDFQKNLLESAVSKNASTARPIEFSEKSSSLDEPEKPASETLRKAFQDFVGQTLFSQMISSMRKTQEGAAYFNGGQAEKIFQSQLDQVLSQELSNAAASKISDPMFKLFQLRRS